MLAKLGYLAFCVDSYGKGERVKIMNRPGHMRSNTVQTAALVLLYPR